MDAPLYSRKQLTRLLELATQLGFTDDIAHWKSEIKKLDAQPITT